jgi:hypothetical protein
VEALGTARLTDKIPADRAVSATIPRREIAAAFGDPEGAPELVLQLVPARDAGAEPATISMGWSRADLERLLRSSDGAEVVLTFDREQLTQAVGDVEAHGMRARAAIFSVAAIGALGSGAAIATAMPTADGGDVVGVAQPSAADSMLTDASSSAGYGTVPASSDNAFLDLHRPSTTDALLAAGLLAIAGASFATRRVGTARPA